MFGFKRESRTESAPSAELAALRVELAALRGEIVELRAKVGELEGEEFKLSELRRQARNAVRSLERTAQNALEASGDTNGGRGGVGVPPPGHPALRRPPGPRVNYP